MKEIEKRITDYIARKHLFASGSRVLAAVSGGKDSMCLLYLLRSLEEKLGITVAAAHFEHGIRGEESLRDMRFVEEQCRALGVEIAVGHGFVPQYSSEHGSGIEESARILRYEFLERTRESLGCDVIATAHNMNDNAETVIFNLARGTGTAGISGIPPARGRIVRPLLCVTRAEIEAYLAEHGIPNVEDSSNSSDDYSRNRIRHAVMPVLGELSTEPERAFFRASELAEQDEDCLTGLADDFISVYGTDRLPCGELLSLHPAVASRVIRRLCGCSLSMERTNAVLAAAASDERKYVEFSGGAVECERGRLYFRKAHGNIPCHMSSDAASKGGSSVYSIPDTVILPDSVTEIGSTGLRVTCRKKICDGEIHGLLNTLQLRCDEIKGSMICSSKKTGDSTRIAGRKCTKTLRHLFLETDLTREERERVPVFRDETGVIAVYGLAVAERVRPHKGEWIFEITIDTLQI